MFKKAAVKKVAFDFSFQVSLPPLETLFQRRRDLQLLARNLGWKTSYSDGDLTITRESSGWDDRRLIFRELELLYGFDCFFFVRDMLCFLLVPQLVSACDGFAPKWPASPEASGWVYILCGRDHSGHCRQMCVCVCLISSVCGWWLSGVIQPMLSTSPQLQVD